jgi:hypothetical protein
VTRVFYASTFFGAMTLAAAIDAGRFGEHSDRRLLIVSNNAAIPEVTDRLDLTPGFDTLRTRFDDVVEWNELIAPSHPAYWQPRAEDTPLLGRFVCERLGLTQPVAELIVESIAVPPARAIATLIRSCPITVFSDGLMSYGPTRDALPEDIARRVERLLYLDLVPSLEPLLLRETAVQVDTVPDDAFAKVLGELPVPSEAAAASSAPVIIGQYLSALDILTVAEEAALHGAMLRALVVRGHRHVVFKPHPAAGRADTRALHNVAEQLRVRLTVAPYSVPAEVWCAAACPELVVSCFSTALLTARRYAATSVATMGCELVLERLTPYQNSNRIPATIVDAVIPELHADGSLSEPPARDVAQFVRAVGYCMQSTRNRDLFDEAHRYLSTYGPARYFKKRRLEAVGLVPVPRYRSAAVYGTLRAGRRALARIRQA